MSERRIPFSYWSDPLCVWAFVAQPKLERVLSQWGRCLDVSYRIVPVFGSIGWRFREGPWAEKGASGPLSSNESRPRSSSCPPNPPSKPSRSCATRASSSGT